MKRAISIKYKQTPRDNLCQTDPYSNTKLKLSQICDKDGNREASLRSYDYNKKIVHEVYIRRKNKEEENIPVFLLLLHWFFSAIFFTFIEALRWVYVKRIRKELIPDLTPCRTLNFIKNQFANFLLGICIYQLRIKTTFHLCPQSTFFWRNQK